MSFRETVMKSKTFTYAKFKKLYQTWCFYNTMYNAKRVCRTFGFRFWEALRILEEKYCGSCESEMCVIYAKIMILNFDLI